MAINKVTQEYIVVQIEQVDLDNRQVHVRDKTNAPFMASFRQHPAGILHVPAPGEKWTAKRLGNIWYLDQRLDTLTEHLWMAANMAAGDTKIYGDTLWLEVESIKVNDRNLGPTVRDFFYEASVGFTSVTLSAVPVSVESIQVYLNGVLAEPNIWTFSGRTLTFIPDMAAGHLVVYYQSVAQAYDDASVVVGRAVISGVDLYP